jgi:DNA invertase Pin-like site-specific DNA recombinase
MAAGKCFLDMLGVFAAFESTLRDERQREEIASLLPRGTVADTRKWKRRASAP